MVVVEEDEEEVEGEGKGGSGGGDYQLPGNQCLAEERGEERGADRRGQAVGGMKIRARNSREDRMGGWRVRRRGEEGHSRLQLVAAVAISSSYLVRNSTTASPKNSSLSL